MYKSDIFTLNRNLIYNSSCALKIKDRQGEGGMSSFSISQKTKIYFLIYV